MLLGKGLEMPPLPHGEDTVEGDLLRPLFLLRLRHPRDLITWTTSGKLIFFLFITI